MVARWPDCWHADQTCPLSVLVYDYALTSATRGTARTLCPGVQSFLPASNLKPPWPIASTLTTFPKKQTSSLFFKNSVCYLCFTSSSDPIFVLLGEKAFLKLPFWKVTFFLLLISFLPLSARLQCRFPVSLSVFCDLCHYPQIILSFCHWIVSN